MMKLSPGLLLLTFLCFAPFLSAQTRDEFWNMESLQAVPEVEWKLTDGNVRELYYSSVPYRGKPTRVFAYLAVPKRGKGPFPAMVLMHGGGGQAFRQWAEYWADRGYVALAMDLAGWGPGTPKVRHSMPGPAMGNSTIMMAADSDEALRQSWPYHAVAAACGAYTILSKLPEVDAGKIGLTGISWGGFATSLVAGLDHRFQAYVPVFGCGFLQDSSYWKADVLNAMSSRQRERWIRLLDPSSWLAETQAPILFVNGENDPRFYLDSTFRSALEVRPSLSNLAILIGLRHGHNWTIPEVDRFIDVQLRGEGNVPGFSTPVAQGKEVSVTVRSMPRRAEAFLNYASTDKPWSERRWESVPASVAGNTLRGELPSGSGYVFFFTVTDEDGLQATSPCGGVDFSIQAAQTFNKAAAGTDTLALGPKAETNSIGMEMVTIPAGTFQMGQDRGNQWFTGGEWDESPVRTVTITRPFGMSATEVTNRQYEEFDPAHRSLRGRRGFSRRDDDAVTFVSWEDAMRFCQWLSQKEGKPYRLPTEAEWEYACRAGTSTAYWTGDTLPEAFYRAQSDYEDHRNNHAQPVSLEVRQSPANPWGLYDMHGNLEEWCLDWYGPYDPQVTTDPLGARDGYGKVTRGGSHNTDPYYLRSANRASALPEDAGNFYIGFRVVQAELPAGSYSVDSEPALVMRDVTQEPVDHQPDDYDPNQPWFKGPRPYVKIEESEEGPLFAFHNHDPAITYCDNGDLIAIWFSTQREWGRELAVAGSRLRYGSEEWDPASVFFDLADRNDHAPAFWRDADGRLYHFNGIGLGGWSGLATIMRTSDDNGATWSRPQMIKSEHAAPYGCGEPVIRTRSGRMILPVDGNKSTEVFVSDDDGKTWRNPAKGKPADSYVAGGQGYRIAGIHAGLVELKDGRLMALGRGADIEGKLAMSLSSDGGETWTYHASEFPSLSAGQRLALKRLQEGPLMVVSFTDRVTGQSEFKLGVQRERSLADTGMVMEDDKGHLHTVHGMFAALSYDEGRTWPVKKLITPGGERQKWFGHGWTKDFYTSDTEAEPLGYLASVQTPDGRIHVISSGLHYEFNLYWLEEEMPPPVAAAHANSL